jgi:tetratricopeptide (TPR) repeat protein
LSSKHYRHQFSLLSLTLSVSLVCLLSGTEICRAEVDKETKRVQAFVARLFARGTKLDSQQLWSMIDQYKKEGPRSEYFYMEVVSRLIYLRDNANALKLCDLGMKEMPNSYQILGLRGQIWTAVDELDKAGADLKKATQMNPKFGPNYFRLANYYLASEDAKAALPNIDKAIAFGDEKNGAFHRIRAVILAQLNRYDEAANEQRMALKMSSQSYEKPLLIQELARYQFGAEKYDDCVATLLSLDDSSKLAPKTRDNRNFFLARCYERLGKVDEAQAALKSIANNSEHYPTSQKMLLELYKKSGRKKEYLEQERKNRDLFKDFRPL